MKRALLIELAATWELQAETGGDGLNKLQPPARETLRACADTLRMLVSTDAEEKHVDELRALLTSAHAIALRFGAGTAWARFAESCKALGIGAITARTYRVLPDELQADGDGAVYLCRAWGETDLPCVTIARSKEEVRQFYVREWLGSEDATDYDGTPTLPRLMEEFDAHPWGVGEPIEHTFEIGGVSVERVFA